VKRLWNSSGFFNAGPSAGFGASGCGMHVGKQGWAGRMPHSSHATEVVMSAERAG
jgi:hypothetical protein